MSDYQYIAAVTGMINTKPDLSLASIAAQLGLNESELAQILSRWFDLPAANCLTVLGLPLLAKDYTQRRLQQSALIDSASLSHASRSVAVTLVESPTESDRCTIQYGVHVTPFGQALIAICQDSICQLSFFDSQPLADLLAVLKRSFPLASINPSQTVSQQYLDRIFGSTHGHEALRLQVRGSAFQLNIWHALLTIECGSLISYAQLAASLDNANAVRAVATAVGANPIAYLIPCHRVIRASGAMAGYRWGLIRKQLMIAREAAKAVKVGDNSILKIDE